MTFPVREALVTLGCEVPVTHELRRFRSQIPPDRSSRRLQLLTQFAQRFEFDLADALACQEQLVADLLQRFRAPRGRFGSVAISGG